MQGGDILSYTRVLVSNSAEDSLSLTDLKETALVKRIFLPLEENKKLGPCDMAMDEKRFLYIVNSYDDSIMKFDLLNLTTLDLIKVGRCPICVKLFNEKIYVVNCDSNSVSVIEFSFFKFTSYLSSKELLILNIFLFNLNNDELCSFFLSTEGFSKSFVYSKIIQYCKVTL